MMLIALCGAKQSGKTTVSETLVNEHGFVRMRFADTLKDMLVTMGLTRAQIDGGDKEKPSKLLGGKTPRWAMQSLGTEWGRDMVSQDLWVNALALRMAKFSDPKQRVVIDDCRFPNEVAMIHGLDGELWRVRRPNVEPKVSFLSRLLVRWGLSKKIHPSEIYWPRFEVDAEIVNDGTLGDLQAETNRILRRVRVL